MKTLNEKATKWFLLAGWVILASCLPALAGIFEDDTVTMQYRLAVAANASTATVVVDLSDTTNYPHKLAGLLRVSSVHMSIDKAAASTCTVKLGVANFVGPSTGSVTWFLPVEAEKNVSNTNVEVFQNYIPNFLDLRVVPGSGEADGTTPNLYSNDKTSGSTIYQTDVTLPSAITAGGAPGPGDIVLSAVTGTAAITVNLKILYRGMRR